jgi:hypothetical protein
MTHNSPHVAAGTFHASFLFDVADTIDLKKLGSIAGESAQPAPLRLRATSSPERIQYTVPPLAANLAPITMDGRTASMRAKIYDYGVIAVRFSFPYEGPWERFVELSAALRTGDQLSDLARTHVDTIIRGCAAALDMPHPPLVEDYFVSCVERLEPQIDAATLLSQHQAEVVELMSAETRKLAPEEVAEDTRLHFSYYPDDLVIVQWDSAFVLDSPANAEVMLDLMEFANSQLVELRTYDQQLDAELVNVYVNNLPRPRPWQPGRRRDTEKGAELLGYLLVDVRELVDRSSNALKIIGDAYYARVYRALASRLGLDVWQRQIESKLAAVAEAYRYLTDQGQRARGEFLELIVIALIAIEIVVGVIGLRHP